MLKFKKSDALHLLEVVNLIKVQENIWKAGVNQVNDHLTPIFLQITAFIFFCLYFLAISCLSTGKKV